VITTPEEVQVLLDDVAKLQSDYAKETRTYELCERLEKALLDLQGVLPYLWQIDEGR